MSSELQQVMEEKSSLDLKVQEYAQSLLSYEETVSLKEQEKNDLVQSYNGLSSQAEKLNATLQKMENSLSTTKLELLTVSQVSRGLQGGVVTGCCGVCRRSSGWRG